MCVTSAKKKTIKGITYYPQKQKRTCDCANCGASIIENDRSYAVGTISSDIIFCAKCVNSIFREDLKQKDKNAIEYPEERILYIGKTHRCSKVVFEKTPYYFCKGNRRKKVFLYNCPVCGEYFLPIDEFREHAFYMEDYKLVSADTGKPYIVYKTPDAYTPGKKYQHERQEIPESLQWAAKHPYQGGGFSGK